MVPPMFMINIGDMYKFQPCIITSVTVNIPEDASWETLNSVNSFEWAYLDEMITSKLSRKNYAQFPKEAEISMTCNLLEKERAIVGGAHFGHAPHTEDYIRNEYIPSDPGKPFFSTPSEFHMGLVEYQQVKDSGAGIRVNNSNPIFSPKSQYEEPGPTKQAQSSVLGQPVRTSDDPRFVNEDEQRKLLRISKTPSTTQIVPPGNTSAGSRTY
jgi:hypothetical protein